MQSGQLGAAMQVFEEVLKNVSSRTKLGGEAELQRAICLDSLVRNSLSTKTQVPDLKLSSDLSHIVWKEHG